MNYKVKFDKKAYKQLLKLDNSVQRLIKAWIDKNLENTNNPRVHGKGLVGDKAGYWRYRIGDYRLITEIRDSEFIIVVIKISHRREVYD
ncbi:type II toxin-antitoxin system RelE/ParE family toxin (plasmid) [Eubacteriales bacterium KG127]